MAEINLPVCILYSENAGSKPEASQVEPGQLWINLTDGTFGSKNSQGAIVSYGLLTEEQRGELGSAATWGSITGDLSQQTDLQNALDQKAGLSGAAFTGTVTISGNAVVTADQLSNYVTVGSDITGNAATATKADTADALTTARTIGATGDATWSVSFDGSNNVSGTLTLANSGVNAGTFGQASGSTIQFGGSFTVPYFSVDNKGRVTAANSVAITLPAAPTTITGNAGSATVLQTARTIDGISFNGGANVNHYAVASEAIDAVAKTATITGFTLATGATAIITLANGNSATNPTLNVSGTGAHAIINTGVALGNVSAGATLMVVYDGTNYQVVGGAGGIDFSQYYTKAEMDAKFMTIVRPTAQGTMSIYDSSKAEAQPIVQAYNAAVASAAENSGVLNCYTKEEADAIFAKIQNPVIIDTLTIEDGADTQVLSATE